jgi:uncharacterized protein (TIGR03437 family)
MRLLALVALAAALCSGADVRTGTYRGHQVRFENVNGEAVYQGDIILGRTADLEAGLAAKPRLARSGVTPQSIGISVGFFFWPLGIIPFVIDDALPAAQQKIIHEAIDHWTSLTPIRLVARTGEYSYVRFTSGTSTIACSSSVGMMPGGQAINLPRGCGLGQTIHEIGHAVGLWHEQSRTDRNRFVTVLYDNIDKQSAYNFDQELGNAQDIGPYDFNSIMHYGSSDFAKDFFRTTIETVPAGIPIGQRDGLSPGDIQAVLWLYSQPATKTTVATVPGGLQVKVDGVLVADGTPFDWAPGDQHAIEAPAQGDDQTRHVFGTWSDGGAAAHTITASADHTLFIASFVRQFKVGTAVYPAGSGTVTLDPVSPDGFYTDRSDIRIQATPASGFNLQEWSVFPPPSSNPGWTTVLRPDTIQAMFAQANVTTIASDPPGRSVEVDSIPYFAPSNFIWTKGETHTIKADTTQERFEHYRFTGWDDGGAQEHSVTATGETGTITATYLPQHSFLLRTDHGGGSVKATPPPTDGYYDEGAVVSLNAIPSGTNVLLHWSGDVRGTQNPVNLTIDGQKFVSADFEAPSARMPFRVVNAATADEGPIAPGEIVSLYGNGTVIGPETGAGASVNAGKVTTSAGGAEVLFDGRPAPITYAGPAQINCVVPYGINSFDTNVQVRLNGQVVLPAVSVGVAASSPGIFTIDGSGRAGGAILNQDGTYNTPGSPAPRGSVIVLYVTGEGLTSPQVADGTVNTTVFPKPLLPVSVRIAGRPATVEYAGAAPWLVAGAMQINVRVPLETKSGSKIPVLLVIGDQASAEGVTLAVR